MAAGVAAAAAAALYAGWRARCEERQRDTRLEEEDKTTRLFDSEDSGRRVEDVYELLEELGSGVHAVVRLGRKRATGERVAVKCVDKANMRRRQLKREIEILTTVCRRPRRPLRRRLLAVEAPWAAGSPGGRGYTCGGGKGRRRGIGEAVPKGGVASHFPCPLPPILLPTQTRPPPTHPLTHPSPSQPPTYHLPATHLPVHSPASPYPASFSLPPRPIPRLAWVGG